MTSSSTTQSTGKTPETARSTLAIIPARKGSKRLKNKNMVLLNGKHLVEYTIDAAMESDVFNRITVSSDDIKILEIAYEKRLYPHKRPIRMAKDTTQVRELCKFILQITNPKPEIIAVLWPSNPFKKAEDLKKAYEMLRDSDANYVMSVKKYEHPPQMAVRKKGKYIIPMSPDSARQSQKLEPLYHHDGNFIFARTVPFLQEFDMNFYGSKCLPYFIDYPEIDIDTQGDLDYAKYLMGVKK